MNSYRVRLIRAGDVARVIYERDVQARTFYDAVSLVEQRCLVEKAGELYDFDGVDRIWRTAESVRAEAVGGRPA